MWKRVKGRLVQTTDESRVRYMTRISKSVLEEIKELAEKHDTFPNYLIETGMKKVIGEGAIYLDKKSRPKEKVFRSTYNKKLLEQIKQLANDSKVTISDAIEYCCRFVDPEKAKGRDYRYRIEEEEEDA